jgi:hypothetical protein
MGSEKDVFILGKEMVLTFISGVLKYTFLSGSSAIPEVLTES